MVTPHGSTVEMEEVLEASESEAPADEQFFDELHLDSDFEIRLGEIPPG